MARRRGGFWWGGPGGGLPRGPGSLPPYDGKALASRDVVVVTVNYRLG
ncbi:hypothetical protein, partial [Klebsiella pneumoniae]